MFMGVYGVAPSSGSQWRREVRAALLRLRVYNAPTSWESVIDWLSAFSGDRQHKVVVLQIWQGCLYEIWKERNSRFHLGTTVPPSKICGGVIRIARSKAVALKNSERKLGTDLVSFWSVA
ncbi:hypothetical protein Bca4012_087256 [Brassica carinata]